MPKEVDYMGPEVLASRQGSKPAFFRIIHCTSIHPFGNRRILDDSLRGLIERRYQQIPRYQREGDGGAELHSMVV